MDSKEVKDSLEGPLFEDIFPQQESDNDLRRRIKEEQSQTERKQTATEGYKPSLTKEMALAAKVALDRQSSSKMDKINKRRLGDQALNNAMGGQGWDKGRH